MKGIISKRKVGFTCCTLLLALVLAYLCYWRFLDTSVIMTVYLPIWFISVVAVLLGKTIFASFVVFFAAIGLGAEYLIHLYNKPYSNMSGAFLNTIVLIFGFVAGAVFQTLKYQKRSWN